MNKTFAVLVTYVAVDVVVYGEWASRMRSHGATGQSLINITT